MKVKLEDLSHDESRKDWTYIHDCTLKVRETDDKGSITETEEKGYIIQGKDMLYLNSPKVYLPNLPTEHQDIAGAFEEVLGKLQDEGGGDEWQPPDWWIPVPEPDEYDVYILIQVINSGKTFQLMLADQQGDTGMGTIICDWGDGTEEIYTSDFMPKHVYTETGQYLIHVRGDENAFFLRHWDFKDQYYGTRDIAGLIVKTGTKIAFRIDSYDDINYTYNSFFSGTSFKYIKVMHPKGLPFNAANSYFANCYDLQKIELAKKISGNLPNNLFINCVALKNLQQFIDCDNVSQIGQFTFGYCYRLEGAEFSNCTEVGKDAFYECYNLIRANLPNCTIIGDYGFTKCYNLQEIFVSEDCNYGTNCFQNCYSLYPVPINQ